MTNKQIIIDGVDVSGCRNIKYEHKWWNMAGHEQNSENVCALSFDKNADFEEDLLCQDTPNCDYKQLKRKEQECEELKIYIESNEQQVKEVETLVMDNDRLINELDQLKFDYAELEKRHNDSFEQFKQLKAENDELKKKCNIYTCGICGNKEDCNKLYKTLTEIKEIAEKNLNIHTCAFKGCGYDLITKQILQKISECEVNK